MMLSCIQKILFIIRPCVLDKWKGGQVSYRGGGVVEMYSVVVSLLWYKEDMSQRGISSKCYILRLFQFFFYVICILTFS